MVCFLDIFPDSLGKNEWFFALLAASFWVPKGTQPKHSNWFLKGGGGVGHPGDFSAILQNGGNFATSSENAS